MKSTIGSQLSLEIYTNLPFSHFFIFHAREQVIGEQSIYDQMQDFQT